MMKTFNIKIILLVFLYQNVDSKISHRSPQLVTIDNYNDYNQNIVDNDQDVKHEKPANKNENEKYKPTWDSLDSRPLPQWYDDAKIGIFLHFGVYAAIPYGTEWFWYNWKMDKKEEYIQFMQRTQKPDFTYQDFASQFTCELFNATEWAEIFADSGAKYVVLTSKHHEGFTLYPSTYSFSWNSMDVGPNLNIVKELSDAVREKSMKFGVYYSLFEWFNRMYIDDKFHGFLQQNYVNNKMFPELQEIVKLFRPEVIWSDGEWEAPDEYWRAKEFLAWLYNESPVHKTVVTNDRWGISTLCKHGDFYTCTDRFNPGILQKHKFENAMTIDKKSWGHRDDAKLSDFYSSEELIKEIVSTIAINGNILINVGPTKYGTIEAIFADRLRDMGKWLRINGDGIYGSRPWQYQKEDSNTTWYTMKAGNTRDSVYVFVTEYPYDTNTVVIEKVGKFMDKSSKIFMLGYSEEIEYQFINSTKALEIKFPEKRFIDKAGLFAVWTLQIDVPKKKKAAP